MDNVSHTLAGIAAAETLLALRCSSSPTASPKVTRLAWVASAAANNLPDLDFTYAAWDGQLGYLLHHRGHTHTVPIALLGACGLFWAVTAWARKTTMALSSGERVLFAGLVFGGVLLHIALDATNNYGVHPFWPLDDRWFYGDQVFIIEPLFWLCTIPWILPTLTSKWARGIWTGLLLTIIAASWMLARGHFGPALVVTAAAIVAWLVARRLSRRARTAAIVLASALVFSTFAFAHARARTAIAQAAGATFAGWTLRDVAMTPLPTNPLCWEAIAVMTRGDAVYALRRAQVAPFSGEHAVDHCPLFSLSEPTTASLVPLQLAKTPAVAWHDEIQMPLQQLRELARSDCRVAAFIRFARVPFSQRGVVGDLRYDRETGLGFAEFQLGPDMACPRMGAPWIAPRGDVL